ncbi:hypothetical protein ACTD5D_40185 [Nocardia takedensis]|uniref:hypothetical protein n=1 Tax=Nocardia takedensis TaxID=259390 RepID=UPI003F75E759
MAQRQQPGFERRYRAELGLLERYCLGAAALVGTGDGSFALHGELANGLAVTVTNAALVDEGEDETFSVGLVCAGEELACIVEGALHGQLETAAAMSLDQVRALREGAAQDAGLCASVLVHDDLDEQWDPCESKSRQPATRGPVRVAVRCTGSDGERWVRAQCPGYALGGYDSEAFHIGAQVREPFRSPVIVLEPVGALRAGCSTWSHCDQAERLRARRYHWDCEHRRFGS